MISLSLYVDQMVKQEQYKDMIREAEHYRLIKSVAQPEPKRLQKIVAVLGKAMAGTTRHSSSPRLANRAQI